MNFFSSHFHIQWEREREKKLRVLMALAAIFHFSFSAFLPHEKLQARKAFWMRLSKWRYMSQAGRKLFSRKVRQTFSKEFYYVVLVVVVIWVMLMQKENKMFWNLNWFSLLLLLFYCCCCCNQSFTFPTYKDVPELNSKWEKSFAFKVFYWLFMFYWILFELAWLNFWNGI